MLAGILFLATLIPRGALRLNPELLDDESLDGEVPQGKSLEEVAEEHKLEVVASQEMEGGMPLEAVVKGA